MSMKSDKTKWVRLGDYIEPCNERAGNNGYCIDDVVGISNLKMLIQTKADMKDVSLSPYKLFKPNEFCYVTVTSRNGGKISLAMNSSEKTYIVSSSYIVFRCKDENELLPEYLFLLLNRSEFDRYSRFNSWGSARETFDWSEMCRFEIPLPDINDQREIVTTYNGVNSIVEQNDCLLERLQNVCKAYVADCRTKFPIVVLGEYIEECVDKNKEYFFHSSHARGVYCDGTFGETRANLSGSDLKSYKVVKYEEFAYSNRINIGSIALNFENNIIVSPSYTVFRVKSPDFLPKYLFLFFRRPEFLRSTLFYAFGTIKDDFSYERMAEVKIPKPPIEVQKAIVEVFNCAERARKIASEAREKLKTLCPALVQRAAHS